MSIVWKEDNPFQVGDEVTKNQPVVHIRIKQRSARKNITTVEGIEECFDFPKIASHLKHAFSCACTVIETVDKSTDHEHTILQLSGDQREKVSRFLIEEGICEPANVKVHGF